MQLIIDDFKLRRWTIESISHVQPFVKRNEKKKKKKKECVNVILFNAHLVWTGERNEWKKTSTRKQIFITFIYTLCVCFPFVTYFFLLSSLVEIVVVIASANFSCWKIVYHSVYAPNTKSKVKQNHAFSRNLILYKRKQVQVRLMQTQPTNDVLKQRNERKKIRRMISSFFSYSMWQ